MCVHYRLPKNIMSHTADEQQCTNITLTASNRTFTRELGRNVSAITDAALADVCEMKNVGKQRPGSGVAG